MFNRKSLLAFAFVIVALAITSLSHATTYIQKTVDEVGWKVTYVGRTYDPVADTTTFSYSLTVEAWERGLRWWVLELCPNVTVVSSTGCRVTINGYDYVSQLTGFKWDSAQPSATSRIYTITVDGNIPARTVYYSVKGGEVFAIGSIEGPGCEEITPEDYFISGTVFLDMNCNGIFEQGEPVIPDVTVDLSGDKTALMLSDQSGGYLFDELLPGSYVVDSPTSTADDDLNEILAQFFTLTTTLPMNITIVDADSTDNNIGYCIGNIDDPSYFAFGKAIGFWKAALSSVITGNGKPKFTSETLLGFLEDIENLGLSQPFTFGSDPLAEALAILESTSNDANEPLKKQLLATELNYVSNRGYASGYKPLLALIIQWAEYHAANPDQFTRDQLLYVKDICDMINNSGE